eukprot:822252_1
MNSKEQMLIAQNASKREYFMSSTKCNNHKIANEYLKNANLNADVAILNYHDHNHVKKETKNNNNNTNNNNNNKLGEIEELYRMTTEEQMAMFDKMEKQFSNNNLNNEYIGQMSFKDINMLQIGNKIDYRDSYGLYRVTEIIEKWG